MGVFIPMAGMLAGVECARRRRCHPSGLDTQNLIGNRRATRFCSYTSSHDNHIISSSSQQRNATNLEDKLEGPARVAKQRLDEKLGLIRKSEFKSLNGKGTEGVIPSANLGLQTEIYGSKKRFSWRKLGRKTTQQDECAVCLECFKSGETLVHLHCAHRFHSGCLLPWLESNAQCPCCRTEIITQMS